MELELRSQVLVVSLFQPAFTGDLEIQQNLISFTLR